MERADENAEDSLNIPEEEKDQARGEEAAQQQRPEVRKPEQCMAERQKKPNSGHPGVAKK